MSKHVSAAAEPPRQGPVARWIERRFGWSVYRILAAIGVLGCVAVAGADLAMWTLLDGYDPIGDTISDAAAGPHSWVMDAGLLAFALGIMALTAGLVLRGRGDARSWLLRAALVLLCIDLGLLALRNEYGDGDPGGLVLHDGFVVLWGVLVTLILWFLPVIPPVKGDRFSKVARPLAIVWAAGAAFMELAPEAILGAYERGLGLILIAAVVGAAVRLYEAPEAPP